MKARIFSAALLSLTMATGAGAQCKPGNAKWPECFVNGFPTLQQLQVSLREDIQSRPTTEVLADSGSGGGTSGPHFGRFARLDAIGLDNLKIHADGEHCQNHSSWHRI